MTCASEINAFVRSDRDELRRMLDELERALDRVGDGEERGRRDVLDRARILHQRLSAHTNFEDSLLVPHLRRSGTRVLRHHQRQRRTLARALRSARRRDEVDDTELARLMRPLIQVLREQVAQEERPLSCACLVDEDDLPSRGHRPRGPRGRDALARPGSAARPGSRPAGPGTGRGRGRGTAGGPGAAGGGVR